MFVLFLMSHQIQKSLLYSPQDSDQAELAIKSGAAFAGGVELIQPVSLTFGVTNIKIQFYCY